MNTLNPIEEPCGALTRARTRCRRRPCKGRRRCHLHGGKSLRGVDHPRFKHGRYSKDDPLGERAKDRAGRRARAVARELTRELAKLPAPSDSTRYVNQYLAACRRAESRHPPAPTGPGEFSVFLARTRLEMKQRRRAAKSEGSGS